MIQYSYLTEVPPKDEISYLNALMMEISPQAKPVTQKALGALIAWGKAIVARDGDANIVGMGSVLPQPRMNGMIARIEHIATAPKHRGQGIARTIMKKLIADAIEFGAFRIDLGTGDEKAERLYKSLGFVYQDHEKVLWLTI